jgi:hypothetical protein
MHPLLQAILPTGITIVLWCVCSAAAALVQLSKNNEPKPQPPPEPTAFITVVRTIPILKELAFEERWQVPAPETMPPTDVSLQLEPDQRASQHAERSDPVCGSKGRALLLHWSNSVMEVQSMNNRPKDAEQFGSQRVVEFRQD